MKDTIEKEKVFDHSIDKVWKAISNAEELSVWFVQADFKPEVGYKYTFKALGEEDCQPITGEVKSATPYTLSYTWVVENTQVETMVTWILENINGKTKLIIRHSGISNYEGNTAVGMFNNFDGGWNNCVSELDKFLLKGVHAV